jgi:hypothetical protein
MPSEVHPDAAFQPTARVLVDIRIVLRAVEEVVDAQEGLQVGAGSSFWFELPRNGLQ